MVYNFNSLAIDTHDIPHTVRGGLLERAGHLLGRGAVVLPADVGYSVSPTEINEPEALELAKLGWTHLSLRTLFTFYNPDMTKKVVAKREGQMLGPALSVLTNEVGITDRLLAAKRIRLRYVSDPEDAIRWLPEEIVKPTEAYFTLQRKDDEGCTVEARSWQIILQRGTHNLDYPHGITDFFMEGHQGRGAERKVQDILTGQELELFNQLFGRFRQVSHALIAASVNDEFSVTPPRPEELWTPVNS